MSSSILPDDYKFFVKPNNYGMTYRQLDDMKKDAEFIQWGRRCPDKFAEYVFGVSFMDYQRYVFLNTWNAQFVVWCITRNGGKSILGGVYLMTRSLLVPNFNAYILCGVGSQSVEMLELFTSDIMTNPSKVIDKVRLDTNLKNIVLELM